MSSATAAPDVGIISTVPGDQYAAYSGTSMAAPQVIGILAAALAKQPQLLALSGQHRVEQVEKLLFGLLRDLGLTPELQGKGRVSLG